MSSDRFTASKARPASFMRKEGPCYRCLFPEPPPPGLVPSCAEGGVLGVLPGTIGRSRPPKPSNCWWGSGQPWSGGCCSITPWICRLKPSSLKEPGLQGLRSAPGSDRIDRLRCFLRAVPGLQSRRRLGREKLGYFRHRPALRLKNGEQDPPDRRARTARAWPFHPCRGKRTSLWATGSRLPNWTAPRNWSCSAKPAAARRGRWNCLISAGFRR